MMTTTMAMRVAVAAVAISVMAGCASAGSSETRSVRSEAFEALVACDYERAEALYSTLVADDPGNAYDYLNLGVAQHHIGRLGAARGSYASAMDLGPDLPIVAKTTDRSTCTEDFPQPDAADADTVGELAKLNLELMD